MKHVTIFGLGLMVDKSWKYENACDHIWIIDKTPYVSIYVLTIRVKTTEITGITFLMVDKSFTEKTNNFTLIYIWINKNSFGWTYNSI